MPTAPTNIIFTGVAGTGKTHQLLQLQKQYDETLVVTPDKLTIQELQHYSWRDIICAVLLIEDRTMTVPEMMRHPLIQAKITANERTDNVSQTLWVQLNTHAHPDSKTVRYSQRSANYYFDKNADGTWYLLAEVKDVLTDTLAPILILYETLMETGATASPSVIARSSLVSFHQAYGYEEFVEGIRPVIGAHGQISYQIQPGAFLKLCQKAAKDPNHRYAMLIDEINRANVARVFGELMSLIETDKRAGQTNAMQVNLAYSGRPFTVPSNVDIYATMNSQDQSLASLDLAFRRRFRFIDCAPNPQLLPIICVTKDASADSEACLDTANSQDDSHIDLGRVLAGINARICQILGQDSQLGHAFLLSVTSLAELQSVLVQQIIPQLAQIAGGQVAVLHYLLNDSDCPCERQFIHDQPMALPNQDDGYESHHHQGSNSLADAGSFYQGEGRHEPIGMTASVAQGSLSQSALGASSGFWLNPHLLHLTGAFRYASSYHQLY